MRRGLFMGTYESKLKAQIEELENELESLPRGNLVYKQINGKKQPYLQYTENGKTYSYYVKLSEREEVLLNIERKSELQNEIKRLKSYSKKMIMLLDKNPYLNKQVRIGEQDFEKLILGDGFYIDKTDFISEWWKSGKPATLITRPRRFGKTLMLSAIECFFTNRKVNQQKIFENLSIWNDKKLRALAGRYPVIFLSFGNVKATNYKGAIKQVYHQIMEAYRQYEFVYLSENISRIELRRYKDLIDWEWDDVSQLEMAVSDLCSVLARYYDQKVILLIDEYDTPMQEAYVHGYWNDMSEFIRRFYNNSVKINNYYEKVLITGIAKISKNSMFSDMNNIYVVSSTSKRYQTAFGFTEDELRDALICQSVDEWENVKKWYDGFTFGEAENIYNPWSITNYIEQRKFDLYWIHTSSNELISKLFVEGNSELKDDLYDLLEGKKIHTVLDEDIVFEYMDRNSDAVWSLLHATGYLKAGNMCGESKECDLELVNYETRCMFDEMVNSWFKPVKRSYNSFINALLQGDDEEMTYLLEDVMCDMVSFFDVGKRPTEKTPERFYHGLVLGLLVDLRAQYEVKSNRESGIGRYDVMLRPRKKNLDGIIIEFKVFDEKKEKSLKDSAIAALKQIEDMKYDTELINAGVQAKQIRKYGIAFKGKEVLIEKS